MMLKSLKLTVNTNHLTIVAQHRDGLCGFAYV